ncbi:protein of unknown function [Candidatus Methylomirabilis oxygeniifera]|uniref:Uncharacterized protein n=1 Tax=Methylomirabilis oxygeniifera TaxID=671143 RepID=D5MLT9_METO1|nr:protein of unknown function [Candidatus Methylomirabilis oxyfera]
MIVHHGGRFGQAHHGRGLIQVDVAGGLGRRFILRLLEQLFELPLQELPFFLLRFHRFLKARLPPTRLALQFFNRGLQVSGERLLGRHLMVQDGAKLTVYGEPRLAAWADHLDGTLRLVAHTSLPRGRNHMKH